MRFPSVKVISERLGVPRETAKFIRAAMEAHRTRFATTALIRIEGALADAGKITFGKELILPGGVKPSIEYVNMGDPYRDTVMFVGGVNSYGLSTGEGRWMIGSWSDLVERGNYE